ncbi:MAG: cation:dicarboxylase symporter family transporter [Candidatus Rhabdochlamydia sp.]
MRLFKISLAFQMAIATVFGILFGLFLGDLCDVFASYASAYIKLLKVTAIPYLIGAIIHGVGQLSSSQGKLIVKRGVFFISLAWIINILMIYTVSHLFPRSSSPQTSGYISSDTPHLNFAELLIPDNIFYDLTNNIVPAIVIFSLLIGIALIHLKEKDVIMNGLQNLVSALTRITAWIARITPIGTFLIIANQVGTIQLSTVKQVSTYVILYLLGTCSIIFWIFPRLTSMLTSIPAYKWLQQTLPILVLAYTTNVVIVCLPYIIELLKKETAIIDPTDEKAQTQIQGTVSVVFNLPLGALFITLFVFFISIFYGLPLGFSSQIELFVTTFLTNLGSVGLGSWINSLTFILDSLGLPINAINLYLTTLPFTSGFQSMLSAMQITSLSLFITLSCRNMLLFRWNRIISKTFFTLLPMVLLFLILKSFNPLPTIKNDAKSIYELTITSTIPVKIYKTIPPSNPFEGDTFDHILTTKTLRVGYYPNVAPFCFYNVNNHLVGYDMAFAYELAYDLGCKLELVPLSYNNVISDIEGKKYDIAMSALSMNEKRLRNLSFAKSYLDARLILVTEEKMRKRFSSMEKILNNPDLKIAVLKGSSYEQVAHEFFPADRVIYLDHFEEFTVKGKQAALLWEEQQALAWILKHRNYRIVIPSPAIGIDTLGYAINADSPKFLNYLNQWLELKNNQGFTEKQYDLWVKGKTEIAAPQEKRWSIVRDVLHWIK